MALEILDQPRPAADATPKPYGDAEADDNLGMLVAWFEDSEEATEAARKASERDRDYYDGKQFTAAELQKLRERGQPDIVINRIQPKVNFLCGYEASNRTDPRAFPRTPQDQEASEAATDALRFVKDATDLDQLFSNCWENLLIEGAGGLELTVEPKRTGEIEIVPVRWDWDRLFWDPHARRHDFSDARYVGGVLWMDVEQAKRRWPEQAEAIEWTVSDASVSRTFDDRPNLWTSRTGTGDRKRNRVRIVQIYYREGDAWHHCTFTKGAKLESVAVPFQDQEGQPWCPLLLQSAFVDRENNRYGLVRIMVGVQDEINKRRSKALHRLTMRQAVTEVGAVEDEDNIKSELAKPDGLVKVNPGMRFELLEAGDKFTAELQLLQEAKAEIELMGPNAALQGKDEDAPSGRAILANQQSGQTEIALLLDRHRHLKKRTYQRIWDLIRQYKRDEWWVRVTDDEKNVKFVGFNRPVTAEDELVQRLKAQGGDDEAVAQQIEQAKADPMTAQALAQVVRVANVPAEMHMDITIEEVPDVASVQEEQFQQLTGLAPAVVFPPQIYIEASSLRNKKRLLEIMSGQEEQDPVAAEIAKITAEQTIKKTEAEIEALRAKALRDRVEADRADAEIGMITDPQIVQPGEGRAAPVNGSVPPPGSTGAQMPPPG